MDRAFDRSVWKQGVNVDAVNDLRSLAAPVRHHWIDFFFEATVLLTSEQRCACQEMQSWRVHVTSFDRWRDTGSRVTERARPSRNDDRCESFQTTAHFALAE